MQLIQHIEVTIMSGTAGMTAVFQSTLDRKFVEPQLMEKSLNLRGSFILLETMYELKYNLKMKKNLKIFKMIFPQG